MKRLVDYILEKFQITKDSKIEKQDYTFTNLSEEVYVQFPFKVYFRTHAGNNFWGTITDITYDSANKYYTLYLDDNYVCIDKIALKEANSLFVRHRIIHGHVMYVDSYNEDDEPTRLNTDAFIAINKKVV